MARIHSEITKKKMSETHKGVPKSKSHVESLTKIRQRQYKVTNIISGQEYFIISNQLPKFCNDHRINYSNLMKAKNNKRIFKKSWKIVEIASGPMLPKKPKIDF